MSLEETTLRGKYPRKCWEVRCDRCYFTASAGITKRSACRHAQKEKFVYVEASDRPKGKGYWLCADCCRKWDARLTIQQYLRPRLPIKKEKNNYENVSP